MLFSTPTFVFVFFPLVAALYGVRPTRRVVLLLASLAFYACSEPVFIAVVLASALLDWGLGWSLRGPRGKGLLALGVGANLGLLFVTKYSAFATLPLGVSFIVFEKITYLVDLHRGTAAPAASLLDYLNYVFLFPKLLAGPIVKYHDIADQLARPASSYADVRDGLIRFVCGLARKLLLADPLATVANAAFGLAPQSLDCGAAWLGLACYTLQIYFDFAGYSDMAIGLSQVLGFRLRENFRDPYLATSVTDFWKRWHISLSTWIREYLYIPLGGNRVSTARSYANLCICFLLSGLWHGASWNFVIWGCLHGAALVADRAFWLRRQVYLPAAVNRALTLALVALGWVFFRCARLDQAVGYLRALAGAPATERIAVVLLQRDTLAVLLLGTILIVAPLWKREPRSHAARLALTLVLLFLCTCRMAISTFTPFLYYRF